MLNQNQTRNTLMSGTPPRRGEPGAPGVVAAKTLPGTGAQPDLPQTPPKAPQGWVRAAVQVALLLGLAAVVDYLIGPASGATRFFVFPVAFAGWKWGWKGGLSAALLAAALDLGVGLSSFPSGRLVLINQLLNLPAFVAAGGLAAFFGRQQRVVREERDQLASLRLELDESIRAARQIQELLTGPVPVHPSVEVGMLVEPARILGGDTADVSLSADGRLAIAIADVSGRGIPAALASAALIGMLEDAPARYRSPAETLRYLNERLAGRLPEEMFITMFYALLDLERGELTYANGGHDPPFLLSRAGTIEELTLGGMALGINGDQEFEERTLVMRPGDLLFCYTDGITDLRQPTGERLGADRLRALVAGGASLPCPELVNWVMSHAFVGEPVEPHDDITLVAARYRGPAEAETQVEQS